MKLKSSGVDLRLKENLDEFYDILLFKLQNENKTENKLVFQRTKDMQNLRWPKQT